LFLTIILRYLVKLWSFPEDRLVRHVVTQPPGEKRKPGPGSKHWLPQAMQIFKKVPELRAAYRKILESRHRNNDVLPTGVDFLYPDPYYVYKPMAKWRRAVSDWMKAKEVEKIRSEAILPRSTLGILNRALDNRADVPRFAVTRLANVGSNQIRIRLLGGTSALHCCLSHFRDRSSDCPVCGKETETTTHFLVKCQGYEDCRTKLLEELRLWCDCEPSPQEPEVVSCAEFFDKLDEDGKAVFILGGPVDGRTPETSVDLACAQFVHEAWKIRSQKLQEIHPEESPIIDLSSKADIRSYFRRIEAQGGSETGPRDTPNTHD
jgi:hypothetical protein